MRAATAYSFSNPRKSNLTAVRNEKVAMYERQSAGLGPEGKAGWTEEERIGDA
jgi:hypothetical protein